MAAPGIEKFRVPNSLAGRLTANGVVPRRLSPIFRDLQDLSAGNDLAVEIEAALAGSQFLVVLCSPNTAKSRWTNLEIELFKRTRPEGCVLAAVCSGEPFASEIPGREGEECFPPALRFKYDGRGRRTTIHAEPLAADFREGGEGRRLAFLKLIAGMLGVGLDELVQRQTTRRQRNLAIVAAASLAGMAVTSTLAVTAIQARNEARTQRRQAERLVEFMVGDLRDKLEPIGKLDVLDGVASRVLGYYSKQDTSQLSDEALLQRSRALGLMGEVALNRGNLVEAEGLYRQAMAGTQEAVRRNPEDPKRLFDHAQNVFWVGEVARYAGRLAEAEASYRDYQRIANQMAALEPDNLKYRMEVLYSNEDVGISLYDQHRFSEAERQFEGAAEPMAELASLYPANLTYRKELATALAWVADTQRSEGNLRGAIATRKRQIFVLNQLLAISPDADARAKLIIAHEGLGVALTESGNSDQGIAELRSAIAQAENLIPIEPGNALWKNFAAAVHLQLANTLFFLDRRDDAAIQTAAGCALTASIPATFAIAARARQQTNCMMMQARIKLANGSLGDAARLAQKALAAAQSQTSEDSAAMHHFNSEVYLLLGDIDLKSGDRDGATRFWSAGLAQLPPNIAERPSEMNERLALLERLGRASDMAPLKKHLDEIGYQTRLEEPK